MTWSLLMGGCYEIRHLSDDPGKGSWKKDEHVQRKNEEKFYTYRVCNFCKCLLLNQT
jgi:hypothetical protein